MSDPFAIVAMFNDLISGRPRYCVGQGPHRFCSRLVGRFQQEWEASEVTHGIHAKDFLNHQGFLRFTSWQHVIIFSLLHSILYNFIFPTRPREAGRFIAVGSVYLCTGPANNKKYPLPLVCYVVRFPYFSCTIRQALGCL